MRLAATGIVALGGVLTLSAVIRSAPADPRAALVAFAVGALALAAFLRPIEPAPGEKFSLAAAAALFGALILPGSYAVAAAASSAAISKVVQRRSFLNASVNVAQTTGATAAASLVASSVGGWVGVVGAAVAYSCVTLGCVGVMIAAAQDLSKSVGFLRRESLPTAALVSVGSVASLVWAQEPALLLLFAPILAAIELGSRRAAAERAAIALRERAREAQAHFAVDAAHELRTPLASVLGELEFLAVTPLRPPELAALAGAQQAARRAAGLVDRLLLLARAGAATDARSDVAEVAAEVIARARRASRLAIEKDIPSTLPVNVSSELLGALLEDLVHNACAYTREGRVVVAARARGPSVEIVVTDTGVGIPRDELPHVFDRFFRGNEAKGMAPGTGLGLAIVREIVEGHGGSVAIESAGGRGTSVTVRLPATS